MPVITSISFKNSLPKSDSPKAENPIDDRNIFRINMAVEDLAKGDDGNKDTIVGKPISVAELFGIIKAYQEGKPLNELATENLAKGKKPKKSGR